MEVAALPARLTDPRERLDQATAHMAAAGADALEAVWDLDERGVWKKDGVTSMSSWLAARYGLARATAREWVRVAHACRDLPHLFRAYAWGRLSWDQLRPLVRFATPQTHPRGRVEDHRASREGPPVPRSQGKPAADSSGARAGGPGAARPVGRGGGTKLLRGRLGPADGQS